MSRPCSAVLHVRHCSSTLLHVRHCSSTLLHVPSLHRHRAACPVPAPSPCCMFDTILIVAACSALFSSLLHVRLTTVLHVRLTTVLHVRHVLNGAACPQRCCMSGMSSTVLHVRHCTVGCPALHGRVSGTAREEATLRRGLFSSTGGGYSAQRTFLFSTGGGYSAQRFLPSTGGGYSAQRGSPSKAGGYSAQRGVPGRIPGMLPWCVYRPAQYAARPASLCVQPSTAPWVHPAVPTRGCTPLDRSSTKVCERFVGNSGPGTALLPLMLHRFLMTETAFP